MTVAASPDNNPQPVKHHRGKQLSEPVKRAIIFRLGSGASQGVVAKEFGISRQTVNAVWKSVKQATPETPSDWKKEQRELAVAAVNRGLSHKKDPYKQGTLGVSVLKGIGEYTQDNSTAVTFNISALPPDWQERYVSNDETATYSGSTASGLVTSEPIDVSAVESTDIPATDEP